MFKCFSEWRRPGSTHGSTPVDQEIAPPEAVVPPPSLGLPINRLEAQLFFGNAPELGQRAFERLHMTVARELPGRWNNQRGRLYCNKRAEVYIRYALELCEAAGVLDEINKLGCFNWRHQRHDPSRPLSYHAYGIALDINPKRNRASADGLVPFSPEWKSYYSEGLSRALVECFENAGFTWGGRWKNFIDPMHFQLVG